MDKTLLLYTGGIDSTLILETLVRQGQIPHLLYINFHRQPSKQELRLVKGAAARLNTFYDVVDAEGLASMRFPYLPPESLEDGDELDVGPPAWPDSPIGPIIKNDSGLINSPSGFHIVLAIATQYAQIAGYHSIYLGAIANQTKNRPQLKEFFKLWPQTISLLNPNVPPVTIQVPLIDKTKNEVIAEAIRIGLDIKSRTWSCRQVGPKHCGLCPSCLERKQAFLEMAIDDPTEYETAAIVRQIGKVIGASQFV